MRKVSDAPTYPVGERIKFYREKLGLTTNALALNIGISQSNLRSIELGEKNPQVETLQLICQGLGISLEQFFSDDKTNSIVENPIYKKLMKLSPEQRDKLFKFIDVMID